MDFIRARTAESAFRSRKYVKAAIFINSQHWERNRVTKRKKLKRLAECLKPSENIVRSEGWFYRTNLNKKS